MISSKLYILITLIILAVIAVIFIFKNKGKKQKKISKLESLSFAFVLAGIIFGDNRLIGYGLIGTGVILAVIDIILKNKK